MNTKIIRKWFCMSQSEFAKYFNISVGTVKNWDARHSLSAYLHNLFFYTLYCEYVEKISLTEFNNQKDLIVDLLKSGFINVKE